MKNLIEQFEQLDLSAYPEKKIRNLFSQLGNIGYMQVILHSGKALMRARPNYNGERFTKKTDFSFKPQKFNTTYQRASTPNRTMFYAATIPENIEPGELDNMRVIGVLESLPLLRNKTSSGYQKISFGRWVVKEDIHLISVIHEERFQENSSYTRELVAAYENFSKSAPPEIIERSHLFHTFLAEEFSKEQINGDYDYMISAIFTDIVTSMGFDGILYPSVRTDGKGFNVAITPDATNKLDLVVAGECSIYKLKDHTVVGNDAILKLDGTEKNFELIEIENHQKECLEQLGLESLDDLITAGNKV